MDANLTNCEDWNRVFAVKRKMDQPITEGVPDSARGILDVDADVPERDAKRMCVTKLKEDDLEVTKDDLCQLCESLGIEFDNEMSRLQLKKLILLKWA